MNPTRFLAAACAAVACGLFVFLALWDRGGGARAHGPEGGRIEDRDGARPPAAVSSGGESIAAATKRGEKRKAIRRREEAASREDPGPRFGVLRGRILDDRGRPVDRGLVLVFARGQRDPVARVAIEGKEREYHCRLPGRRTYAVMVDPASVEGLGAPPTARGWARARRSPEGAIRLEEYARRQVRIGRGKTVRLDLRISALGSAFGRLVDGDGTPLPGIVARVAGLVGSTAGNAQDATTDGEGVFRFHHLFPGAYRVTFWRPEDFDTFRPPLPVDFELAGGEDRDLGDVPVASGNRIVRGRLVDQDGRPFPGLPVICYPRDVGDGRWKAAHDQASVLQRARTDEDGVFELVDLPALPVAVNLTPAYEPGRVGGPGRLAFWEPTVPVDLSEKHPVVDIGVHVVQESRPFRIQGRLVGDLGRYGEGLRATVDQTGDPSTLPGVRRSSLRRWPVEIDLETGAFHVDVETPRPEIELRFRVPGFEDLVFSLQPEPLGLWAHDIALPEDLTPRPCRPAAPLSCPWF